MKRNIRLNRLVVIGAAVMFLMLATIPNAEALLVTHYGVARIEGRNSSALELQEAMTVYVGNSIEIYRDTPGGAPALATTPAFDYSTSYGNTGSSPSDATLRWNGAGQRNSTVWLMVMNGQATPTWYLFNLTALGWDGMETVELQGFWPNQGAISRIALYETQPEEIPLPPDDNGTHVPDGGGTLFLAGLGFLGLVSSRRFLK